MKPLNPLTDPTAHELARYLETVQSLDTSPARAAELWQVAGRLNAATLAAARAQPALEDPAQFTHALSAGAETASNAAGMPIPDNEPDGDEPTGWSIAQLARGIRDGTVTSRAVTEAVLARIEQHQSKINCFIAVEADEALDAADRADREIRSGRYRGPLHGVPLAHKDVFLRSGRSTTSGMRVLDEVADRSATVIERLEQAGAVTLGVLNLDEFAGFGDNEHYGRCCNPWNAAYISGGSSSGPAAGVAARLTYGAFGSDAGGSIRAPAAMCGVLGLKPTQGRISRHGNVPTTWSVDCIGPLARSAEDCAILLSAVAGRDPADPTSHTHPVDDYRGQLAQPLDGLRIGLALDDRFVAADPEVEVLLDAAVECLRNAGATPVGVDLAHLPLANDLQQVLTKCERGTLYGEFVRERPADLSFAARSVLEEGFLIPASRYLEALALRPTLLRDHLERVHSLCDVVLLPTLPGPVMRFDEVSTTDSLALETRFTASARYTRFANYLGVPGLSVPCGFTGNGLPMGFQLLGRPFSEALLLRIAHWYQSATDWHRASPGL